MKSKYLTYIAPLLITLSLVFAPNSLLFAAAKPPGEVVWKLEQQFVSLVPQDEGSTTANDHPVTLSVDTIAQSLYSITVSDKKSRFSFGGKKADLGSPLFSEYEIEVLSGILAKALANSTAQQDVIFRIHGGKEQLGGLTQRRTVNTGRVFWKDKQLHIIFGEVHGGDKSKWLYGQKEEDKSKRKFGSRSKESDKVKIIFTPVPGITQQESNNGIPRADWIAIDPEILFAAINNESNTTEQATTTTQQPVAAPVTQPAVTQQVITEPSPAIKQEQERSFILKLRLKELKELRDEGLITEEVYQQKVVEVLDKSL